MCHCIYILIIFSLSLYCIDPPKISVEGTSTPAVEYTTRKITCRTSDGNPSDPRSYDYKWVYKPTYGALGADIHVPPGMIYV